MSSASAGLGWDVRRFAPDVRFGVFLLHAIQCARDAERGPWAAHVVRTWRAERLEGPTLERLAALGRDGVQGGDAFIEAEVAGGARRPALTAGPPIERPSFDATLDLANLIANAESQGVAVTWCDGDVRIGGFVYRLPQRTARRRDPREAPRGLDPRGLPSVTIGDLVVVLNPAQSWVATFEVMLHELAHALLGHLGPRPSVRQAPDLIAVRERPSHDAREYEANAAAYVAAMRRGDSARRVGLLMMVHYASLDRDGALTTVDLLEIFRVAEVLAAWCRIRPQSVGVLSVRDRLPPGPPLGAIRVTEEREERVPVVGGRSKVLA